MSDNETAPESSAQGDKKPSIFTEKEERILKVAWQCLRSGLPEIDMEKLTKLGGFNTQKTASNTWGVIKKKLFSDADGNALPTAPSTPKGPKTKKAPTTATPKKRTKKEVDDDEDDDNEGRSLSSKKKKPSPVKKLARAVDSDDEE